MSHLDQTDVARDASNNQPSLLTHTTATQVQSASSAVLAEVIAAANNQGAVHLQRAFCSLSLAFKSLSLEEKKNLFVLARLTNQ